MLVAALSRSSAFAWLPNESFPLNTFYGVYLPLMRFSSVKRKSEKPVCLERVPSLAFHDYVGYVFT